MVDESTIIRLGNGRERNTQQPQQSSSKVTIPPNSNNSSSYSNSSNGSLSLGGSVSLDRKVSGSQELLDNLRKRGVPASDPRWAAARKLIASSSLAASSRMEVADQPPTNTKRITISITTGTGSNSNSNSNSDKNSQNSSGGEDEGHPLPPPSPSSAHSSLPSDSNSNNSFSFAPSQRLQMAAQVLALRSLSRGQAPQPNLLVALRGLYHDSYQELTRQHRDVMLSAGASDADLADAGYDAANNGMTPNISAAAISSDPPLQRPLQRPSINPLKFDLPPEPARTLDLQRMVSTYENRVHSRITQRAEEIAALLAHPLVDEQTHTQLSIEAKKLNLLNVQREVRARVVDEMSNGAQMVSARDPHAFRKSRTFMRQEATLSERLQQHQTEALERQREKKRHLFLEAVMNHSKVFKEKHAADAHQRKKVGRSVLKHLEKRRRMEETQRKREEKERLKALRTNDEEAYLKLVAESKNNRLHHLLNQTDEFLGQLGVAIEQEKQAGIVLQEKDDKEKRAKEKREKEGDSSMEDEEEAEETKSSSSSSSSSALTASAGKTKSSKAQAYYTQAHTIEEEVTCQPEMLVGGTLKEYQVLGLQWMVSLYNNNLNGILADEMGLGKTIQTIALIAYLMEVKGNSGPYLVIVPLSTLPNWINEFEKWAPAVNIVAYKGVPKQRKEIFKNRVSHGKLNCLLTTYDFVIRDKSALSKLEWNYIIIDEGHRMKNHHCKLAMVLGQYYRSRHRVLLTGTPLQNSLPELWALLNFLLPTIFKSVDNFEEWFNAPFAGDETLEMTEEETLLVIQRLHKVLRPFLLRRLKSEVLDQLPSKTEKVLKVAFSGMQKRMYASTKASGQILLDQETGARGLRNTLMQLRKICNHPYLFKDEYDLDEDIVRSSGKFALLDRMLPKLIQHKHRMLIFCQMTHLMDVMEDFMRYRGISYLRLDGNTKADDRGDLLAKFNAPNPEHDCFILSTRAGGLGLNLQTADTVIIFDSDWNPTVDLQAQDRAHRIGQKNSVSVFRLISVNSVEEHILKRANFKLALGNKIIEAGKFNSASTADERRSFLEQLLQDEDDGSDASDAPSDKQLNRMLARTDEEYKAFVRYDERMDKEDSAAWKEDPTKRGIPFSRLLSEAELPEFMMEDIAEKVNQEDVLRENYGRGRRERSDINYAVDVSDRQFERLLDGELDFDEARTKSRRGRRVDANDDGRSGKRQKAEVDDLKRKRKSLTTVSGPGANAPPHIRAINNKCTEIWTAVREYKEEETGRQLSQIFVKLPSRRFYRDYYSIIKKPMSLDIIRRKCEECAYYCMEDFKADVEQIFNNATTYNAPGTQVYIDAVLLRTLGCDRVAAAFPDGEPTKLSHPPPPPPPASEESPGTPSGRGRKKRRRLNNGDEDGEDDMEEEKEDEEIEIGGSPVKKKRGSGLMISVGRKKVGRPAEAGANSDGGEGGGEQQVSKGTKVAIGRGSSSSLKLRVRLGKSSEEKTEEPAAKAGRSRRRGL
eukprot:TRINITY_DN807_c0_g1_i1.p1 TRINITY_DN807_c0_g1~~TRINITY_DN807_c0_g1_i1.p1  ORF type:complete len:1492 (-),score=489.09 TRINITY_DN807_c0_g1_i1:45-4520(-)